MGSIGDSVIGMRQKLNKIYQDNNINFKSMSIFGLGWKSLLIITCLILTIETLHSQQQFTAERLHRKTSVLNRGQDQHQAQHRQSDQRQDQNHLNSKWPEQSHRAEDSASGLVDLSKNYYKNNLRNLNWYYGSITPSQYRVRLFVSATEHNLTSCPYNRPYVKQKELENCFQCPPETPLYNLGDSVCQPCPKGKSFDKYLGNCSAPTNASKQGSGQPTNLNPNAGIQSILQQQKKNKTAPLKTNQTQKQNQIPPNNTNNIENQPQNTTDEEQPQSEQPQNQYPQNQQPENGQQQNTGPKPHPYNCTPDKPLFVNNISCQACKENEEYVKETNECKPKIFETNPNAERIILPSWKYLQQEGKMLREDNKGRNIYVCPIKTPYWIDGTCSQCQDNNYFNASAQNCVAGCDVQTVYDKKLRMCVNGTFITNPNSSNLLMNIANFDEFKNEAQKQLQTRPHSEYCPKETPYSIGNVCESCPGDKPYFNVDFSECQGCQSGRYYSGDDRKCLSNYDGSLSLDRMIMNII